MQSGGAQRCAGPERHRHLEEHVTASSRQSFTWIQWCGGPVSADKVCVVVLPSLEWLDRVWKDSAVGLFCIRRCSFDSAGSRQVEVNLKQTESTKVD